MKLKDLLTEDEIYRVACIVDPYAIKRNGWTVAYDNDGKYIGATDTEGNFHPWNAVDLA